MHDQLNDADIKSFMNNTIVLLLLNVAIWLPYETLYTK